MQLAWEGEKYYIQFHSEDLKNTIWETYTYSDVLVTRYGICIGNWFYWSLKTRNYL
jgi:hypothetical protein